ncbi:MAG: TatD family hydrolase [Thermodesulfovibrionales bacterium]
MPLIPLIDTHCHLEMDEFAPDRPEVIHRAAAEGIVAMITVGSDLDNSRKALQLAADHASVYASIGVHPHAAEAFTAETAAKLREWSGHPKVVAIGETGLDYHYNRSPKEVQARVFREHLEIAKSSGLPAIIHSREAADDTMKILRESGLSHGVLHCFSGDRKMASDAISGGLFISIAGPVTFKKSAGLKEMARLIPDDCLLIETDAPYLTPEPFRGRRNEPSFVKYTAQCIAELRGISLEDLARITTLNARRLFSIGTVPEKAEIAYKIRNSLYLNVTNRCTNACTFCVKFQTDYVKGHRLRLDHEPSAEEVRASIGDPSAYQEVVFCGYGEPLSRFELVKDVARWIKQNNGRVRINTNGQAALIHGRNILPELRGLVDSISISLDAQDKATYDRICRPAYENAYEAVLQFIKDAREAIPEVRVTVVDMEGVDVQRCREIAEELGVLFAVRKLDVVG